MIINHYYEHNKNKNKSRDCGQITVLYCPSNLHDLPFLHFTLIYFYSQSYSLTQLELSPSADSIAVPACQKIIIKQHLLKRLVLWREALPHFRQPFCVRGEATTLSLSYHILIHGFHNYASIIYIWFLYFINSNTKFCYKFCYIDMLSE